MPEYKVPEQNYGWLKEKVDELNKRAVKLGVAPIEIRVVGEETRKFIENVDRQTGRTYLVAIKDEQDTPELFGARVHIKYLTVEVVGEAPVLNGWKFIGTIQHVQDGGENITILRAVPGQKIPDEYRGADARWCDQCRTRQLRNDTFVVQSVEKIPLDPLADITERVAVTRRVGRNCLKDFIGHPKPEMYADWAEKLSLLHDLFLAADHNAPEGRIEDRWIPTEAFMAAVVEVIKTRGWVSGKMAFESRDSDAPLVRTSGIAANYFIHTIAGDVDSKFEITKESFEQAKAALAWARSEEGLVGLSARKQDNDYLYNLVQVSKLDALNYRMLGIAASLIPTFQRETRPAPSAVVSTHFGKVGVRMTTVLKVLDMRFVENERGSMTIMKFETAEGDLAVWFTGGTHGFKVGETYRVKLTVKRHDEYKGTKQTGVNRVVEMKTDEWLLQHYAPKKEV